MCCFYDPFPDFMVKLKRGSGRSSLKRHRGEHLKAKVSLVNNKAHSNRFPF